MDEKLDSAELRPHEIVGVPPFPQKDHSDRRNQGRRKPFVRPDETKDHFGELSKAAELAHEILVRTHSPFRFCVYKENGEVFIDLVILDANGKIGSIRKQKITHEQFFKWIEHIQDREGFFIDEQA